MRKANDNYLEFIGTEHYYNVGFNLLCTDGVMQLIVDCKSFWLLSVIYSYQPSLKNQEFQVWKLIREEGTQFQVTATDGNDNVLVTQKIPFSDFKYDECELWVEGNVILLPSEH